MTTFVVKPPEASEDFGPLFEIARLEELPDDDKQQYYHAMITDYQLRVTKEYSFKEGMEKGLARGKELGLAEGRMEGESAGRMAVARNLLAAGVSPEIIAKATGLTAEALAAL